MLSIFSTKCGVGKCKDRHIDLIRNYVDSKSFADIGCRYSENGLFFFIAEKFGVKRVVAVKIYPESEEFKIEAKKRGSKI